MDAQINLTQLRALAAQATPGPWEWNGEGLTVPSRKSIDREHGETIQFFRMGKDGACWDADATFIAACSPTTINGLLDEIEQMREALKKYGRHLDTCVPVPCVEPTKPHNCSGDPCICGLDALTQGA